MQRVLGFDFGLRRIGVAVGQTLTQTATPVTTILAKEGTPDWGEISELIKHWNPSTIVVGVPLNMDGTDQAITTKARHFARELQMHTDKPVALVDERLSTKEARWKLNELKEKTMSHVKVDALAACLIVETWLKSV